ncbi:MAG: hypothetical protein OEX12_02620 [Gammaproteobacteria bacterium]|nr:hypothetical protein [Gammaproteobacteria bacterium]
MSPRNTILTSTLFCLMFAMIFLWLTYSVPWLGIDFSVKSHLSGLVIKEIEKDGPADSILTPGMQIVEIGNEQQSLLLDHTILIPEPADLANFARYNRFVENNQNLYSILSSGSVWLKDIHGKQYTVAPEAYRHLSSLKPDHIAIILVSVISIVFHYMLARFKRHQLSIQVLTVTALAYPLHILIGQTTFFRELVVNPLVLEYIHPLQMLSALFYAYFLMGLMFYYPTRLLSRKAVYLLFALAITFWLNLISQTITLPDNTYLTQFNILFLIAIFAGLVQWRKAKGSAIKMAQIKWFFLAMFGGAGLNIIFNIVPQSLGRDPYVGISTVLLFSYLIFIGIAIGIYRYRLFNIDRWWFSVWSWFFAGLAIVLLDLAFISLVNIDKQTATIASLLIVGWIYFPVRQRIWQAFSYTPHATISQHLPEIVSSIVRIKTVTEVDETLISTLKSIFNAQHTSLQNKQSLQISLHNSGLSLSVPDINGNNTIILEHAEQGARLFSSDDIALATGISELFKHSYSALNSKEQGAIEERERIMSDLHDDLGPKLLTLIHSLHKPRLVEIARDSLHTLRDIVYSIQYQEPMSLYELLEYERHALNKRVSEKGREIIWHIDSAMDDVHLNPESILHLKRIFNELISNELRHSASASMTFSVSKKNNIVSVRLCTANQGKNIEQWKVGVGLGNLTRRSKALEGTIQWKNQNLDGSNTLCFELLFPDNNRAA